MSIHLPDRAERPEHRHPLAQPDGLPPIVKASIAVALLPVALVVAVVLSLRAEMAPDRLAVKPPAAAPCGSLVGDPAVPVGPDVTPYQICLH